MGKAGLWGILLWLLASSLASAAVYRWVDDSGKVHFADRPHEGQGEVVTIQPAPALDAPARPAAVPDRQRMLDMYQHEREARQAAKVEQAKARVEQQRECARTANTLRRYEAGGVLYEDRPAGRHFFTAAEKDQEMAELRAQMKRDCGGVPTDLQPKGGR